ncbi:hypothetical protein rosag_00850 [Roseisolibacter agri]|uniref:Uncharacterized protein n=1 Tax=Roseisolibacter agri TaxID=2014610 RepID=A0AA37Q2U2_9BACT|nr:hypothetical protein rosag_00850 [Roseisolibacter agri]
MLAPPGGFTVTRTVIAAVAPTRTLVGPSSDTPTVTGTAEIETGTVVVCPPALTVIAELPADTQRTVAVAPVDVTVALAFVAAKVKVALACAGDSAAARVTCSPAWHASAAGAVVSVTVGVVGAMPPPPPPPQAADARRASNDSGVRSALRTEGSGGLGIGSAPSDGVRTATARRTYRCPLV